MNIQELSTKPRPICEGLGAILGYDPYFARMSHSLKTILADGHPIMIRLHSAGRYPLPSDKQDQLDLESHAVLLVGYDEELHAFAYLDPWTNGTVAKLSWIDYEKLRLSIVNSSLDCHLILAPIDVEVSLADSHTLRIRAGFYSPDAITMDKDNHVISRIECRVRSDIESQVEVTAVEGAWGVGQKAEFDLPTPVCRRSTTVEVVSTVEIRRPYPCRDDVRVVTVIPVAASAGLETAVVRKTA